MPSEQPPLEHIGFILDGNRRWAKERNKPTLQGHQAGYDNLKKVAEACFDRGIKYFSCYVFSTENWRRSQDEVSYLMRLVTRFLSRDAQELHEKNIRLKILGTRNHLDKKIVQAIDDAEQLTAGNTAGTLLACFNYGGQEEIVSAVQQIVSEGMQPENITVDVIKDHLYTAGIPAPDMIVRTSGEMRLSNFLLWDSAYAELSFIDKYWPDFGEADLDQVLADYDQRVRRFGN